ncbi:MAG TPA: hypothetical protein VIK72_02265 [Clostridiaceae bacterium]
MNSVLSIKVKPGELYDKYTRFQSFKDRVKIEFLNTVFLKDLNLKIYNGVIPPNINSIAFKKNIEKVIRKPRENISLAPKTFRKLDLDYYSSFQRELFYYSIVNSIKLILRARKKSIQTSPILVYDGADPINRGIISVLSMSCQYLILLSKDIKRTRAIQEYIISNYGVTPIVTNDVNFALEEADFIISSKDICLKEDKYIWVLDKSYNKASNGIYINDVSYCVPWKMNEEENRSTISLELLGAILGQMEEKSIYLSLKKNQVFLDNILFNDKIID